ncbi:MAG: Holliday junction resolvase RuvX [Candidatus Stygibacter frigidus]|nr:Holliday junction resolvase RuvX [Candidatus Stygibacter frigidus]
MKMDIYRLLAIDYGEKRIGIALSDPMRTISKPYRVLANAEGFWEELNAIISSENVGRIILGLPLNFEGEDTQKTKEVRAFGTELTDRVNIPWEFYDESFTSQDANKALKTMGYSIKDSRKVIDMMAAALILRNYLDN